jgi:hypothetical protein
MKNLITFTLAVIIIIAVSFSAVSQEDSTLTSANAQDSAIINYFNNLSNMHIGYYGTTQKCEAYDVYAFKYHKNWFLIVSARGNLSFMHINAPVEGKRISYPSKFFIEGIARSYATGYTKLKTRKRNVVDMDIYGYYKFNRRGKKVMKGMLLLEYPFVKEGFLWWKVDVEEAKAIVEEKVAEEVEVKSLKLETIKPEINENIPLENK